MTSCLVYSFFFFNDTATTEIYTLSLHDALPISLKKKVKKALFYPAAVLVVAVIVTGVLLLFVIPQFESLYKGFGADLPAFTQAGINLSKFVQHDGIYIAIMLGLAAYAFVDFKKRSEALRGFVDRL